MAAEEINTIYIPFVGEFEVNSLKGAGVLLLGLTIGQAVKHMTDDVGANLAQWGNGVITSVTGTNPATGEEAGAPGV